MDFLKKTSLLVVSVGLTGQLWAQNTTFTSRKDTIILRKDSIVVKDTTKLKKSFLKKSTAPSPSNRPTKRLYSRIINDSSKTIYGPTTTRWITEEDLFMSRNYYKPLDTAIRNFHRWTFVQRLQNQYQDLGNIGTAMYPIFPQLSSTIGASSGFTAYDPYYQTAAVRHYDSKSPFTRIYVVWAGNGRAMTHIEFTRNIHSRWNFGFNYRPILADKQIQRRFTDRQTISHYYDFFTNYKSKNDRYFILLEFRRMRMRIKENGGVLLKTDTTFAAFFDQNILPTFTTAETEDLRYQIHVQHHYQLAKSFQLYQTTDYYTQANFFRKDRSDVGADFFKQLIVDSLKTVDEMRFKTFTNEVGVKGKTGFLFYNVYYKSRSVNNTIPLLAGVDSRANSSLLENYVGGKIALRIDSLSELRGSAEWLMNGNYKIQGNLNTPWLEASLFSFLAKPGYFQRAYRGSHNYWLNNFSNTFSNQLTAFFKTNWKGIRVSPGVSYTVFKNYIYFISSFGGQRPIQSGGFQEVFSPEIRLSIEVIKRFTIATQTIYTQLWRNDGSALRIPKWFINAQLSYHNFLFDKALQLELGVDFHWKSNYLAMAYAPDIQTYYLQNHHIISGYPLTDIFLNAKIKGGRLFVKYHNVSQAVSPTGYMLTYTYPAVGNIIDFGFEILLFD